MTNDNRYCLILAGGVGSRLWPVSRTARPKQFLDLFGAGRTLLQQTYDRFARFLDPSHIYVSTHVDYLPLVREQLPEVDEARILEEPLSRGTLAAVAWGTVVIAKACPQAAIAVTPADQLILGGEEFEGDMSAALDFVADHSALVVMGIRPTRPETDYGYIQKGAASGGERFYKVRSFTEKPQLQFAEMFVEDGDFLWNTGLFAFRADVMLDTIYGLVPEYQVEIPKMMADAEAADAGMLPDFFSVLPKLSLDLGIMERSDNVHVRESRFGWADLGTWATLRTGEDGAGNVTMNTPALLHNCQGNVISLPPGRKAVIEGLTDYVVAEQGDVLLVCPKSRANVRRMMTDAQMRLGVE